MESYLITGATGFIGGLLVRELAQNMSDAGTSLIIPVRDEAKAKAEFRDLLGRPGLDLKYVPCSVETMTPDLFRRVFHVDYVIHCASPTQSAYLASHPVETMNTIILGTRNALELARYYQVKSMVFVSSMESYGVVKDIGRTRTEEEVGEIPLCKPRSSYPLGKRAAEFYCNMYCREFGVPVKIARLAQVFGKGARKDDTRVFAQFARAVIEEHDIVLETDGSSMGNYCASEDAVNAILTILKDGKDGEVYNVVNEANTMTIREMAELVCREVADGRICVRINSDVLASEKYAPKNALKMSSQKLRDLGWKPQKSLADIIRNAISDLE